MRLFVALDLSDDLRGRLAALLRELQPAGRDIKWAKPESLHLTLKFIGEQPEDKLPAITDALTAVARPGPIELAFRGLGSFPNERRPRVFWVGIEAPPQLAGLAADIERVLEPLGMEREQRPFAPHLTLGRLREGGNSNSVRAQWDQHRADDFGCMKATEFFLFQSRLSPAGAEYTKLRAFPL